LRTDGNAGGGSPRRTRSKSGITGQQYRHWPRIHQLSETSEREKCPAELAHEKDARRGTRGGSHCPHTIGRGQGDGQCAARGDFGHSSGRSSSGFFDSELFIAEISGCEDQPAIRFKVQDGSVRGESWNRLHRYAEVMTFWATCFAMRMQSGIPIP